MPMILLVCRESVRLQVCRAASVPLPTTYQQHHAHRLGEALDAWLSDPLTRHDSDVVQAWAVRTASLAIVVSHVDR